MSATLIRHPFIFSDSRKYKLQRHLVLWVSWWLFQSFLYSFIAVGRLDIYSKRLLSSFLEAFVYLIPHIFLAYTLMYFVLPRFVFKEKYGKAIGWVAILCICTAIISSALTLTIIERIRTAILGYDMVRHGAPAASNELNILFIRISLSLMAGLRGGITIGGMAAAIKLMKYWYLKEQRNQQLQIEKTEAQLQLLKAQIHPHFLFNTLNNIYSLTQNLSKPASELVFGLSDILRYMLYETNQPLVPLQKELSMMEQYITLETIRYGNKLDTHVSFSGPAENFLIAPLLLIPFVENSYKHGCSQIIDSPWLSLQIAVDINGLLTMKLLNSKPTQAEKKNGNGIGIKNVQKRLELLYPGKHQLDIMSEDDVFIVNLSLELERKQAASLPAKKARTSYDFA